MIIQKSKMAAKRVYCNFFIYRSIVKTNDCQERHNLKLESKTFCTEISLYTVTSIIGFLKILPMGARYGM